MYATTTSEPHEPQRRLPIDNPCFPTHPNDRCNSKVRDRIHFFIYFLVNKKTPEAFCDALALHRPTWTPRTGMLKGV